MARGGGGHSGGGGGFHGGGHSGGGFSGGGRGGFSGGHSGGFSGGHSGGFSGGGSHYSGGYGGGSRRYYGSGGGGGCGAPVILVVVVLIIILSVIKSISSLACSACYTVGSSCVDSCSSGSYSSPSGSTSTVQKSTEKREKIDTTNFSYSNVWYEDSIGWLSRSGGDLIRGLESFYQKTGVQPLLLLVPYGTCELSTDAEKDYLEERYTTLFNGDEGHLLFAYFACENDTEYTMDGDFYFITGKATQTVMDEEAKDILISYVQYYYYNCDPYSVDVGEMFGTAFQKAGEEIMSGPVDTKIVVIVVVGSLSLVAIIVLIIVLTKIRNKQKNKEQEDLEKILSKPLETFGDSNADDLKAKYSNQKSVYYGADDSDASNGGGNSNSSNEDLRAKYNNSKTNYKS